ncbi:glycine-rich domain-containing protein [Phaeobacter italicus]|uniref:glycine-rich domain-containing protein n=1 Tax=Phaeobacter italicus TaxID=481446 RepID=UPI003CC8DB90
MPRNPSGEYSLPASYLAVDGQTARADQHNEPLEDLRDAMNEPTPIAKGGHGATTAAAGLAALGGMPKAGGVFTGGVTIKGLERVKVELSGVNPVIDLQEGTVFSITTTGDTTFSFSNPAASGRASLFVVLLEVGGAHTVSWPASVRVPPPALSSGGIAAYIFLTTDAGLTYEHLNSHGQGVDVQQFSNSGTWTKPTDATVAQIYLVGAGGGGANETATSAPAQGGAGGEGFSTFVAASSLGATESVTIGAGGAGAPSGTNGEGADGGSTSFGSSLVAYGGRGGARSTGHALPSRHPETESSPGYDGHFGYSNRPTILGGGGGGISYSSSATSGGGSEIGGDGGSGSFNAGIAANDGNAKGGGGGGSTNDGGGGNGGDGYCLVISW